MTFQQGQIVQLKSGSPALTVHRISENGAINVTYWSGGDFAHACFYPEMLDLVEWSDKFVDANEAAAKAEAELGHG